MLQYFPRLTPLWQPSLEAIFNTPMKTKGPIAKGCYSQGLFHTRDLPHVLETVEGAVQQATIQRGKSHEPNWVSKVVTPIMSRLQRLSSSKLVDGRQIEDLNMLVSFAYRPVVNVN